MTSALHITGEILCSPDGATNVGELWVIDGKVTFDAPPAGVECTQLRGFVLPGLVDAHCHVGLGPHGAVPNEEAEQQALTDRDSGTLLIRDAGSPVDTRWLQDRDDMPDIIRAGRHIARTRRYLRHYAHEVEPVDLAATMAEQARLSDGWVKIVGDWIDRDLGDLSFCWTKEAVQEGIAAAHALGAKVTAHCFATESLEPLVDAGIDCIEHATGLTPELVVKFADRGVAIVPTLVNILTFPEIADAAAPKFPAYEQHMRRLYEQRYQTIGLAHEAGVPIFTGTDAGGVIGHGLVPQEVVELTKAGLSNVAAVDAATWGARRWLGRPAIVEGASADLVVYATNPLDDVRVLADPAAIVLRGNQVHRAG